MRFLSCLCLYLALAALTVAAYLPVWQNQFVDFDDLPWLLGNPDVTEGLTWSSFCRIWDPGTGEAPYWMPLTWLSFQLDAQLFSSWTPAGECILSPVAFHGHNLFWHTAGVLLLFGFCRHLTGKPGPSFLIAALFAVHPMHVESVAWAIERKDVLSGFFGVLTLWAYVRYTEKPSWRRYAVVAVALLLSLLAKPMLITLPFLLLLLDYWPLRRMRSRDAKPVAELILEKLPLVVIALVIAVITLAMRERRGSLVSLGTISLSARIANAPIAYHWYLLSTFWPTRLAVLYPHPYDNWSLGSALLGATMLLACTGLAWRQARRRPWLIVGWLWFVTALVPVIGFAQGGKQAWADRFSYWAHLGLFLAVVLELAAWSERGGVSARICRFAAAAVLGCLAFLTWQQVGVWRDTPTLWQHALRITHDNDQAHEHLARYYYVEGQSELCQLHIHEAARIQLQRSFGLSTSLSRDILLEPAKAAETSAADTSAPHDLTASGSAPYRTASEGDRHNGRSDAGESQ
jgi:protein O-mannosyl-transferase